ncbi:hypothetical protein [Microbulbifer sp. S227A]|uniref:hypothetical protein n=1 Tax=Microbulbifer sp. S227A TaxID=3415131 RepID=UPI003C7C8341
MFRLFNFLFLAILAALGSAATAQTSLWEIDPTNTDHLRAASARCSASWDSAWSGDDLCSRSFLCGEAGCDPLRVIVLVDATRQDEFLQQARTMRFTEIAYCDPADPFQAQYFQLNTDAYVPYIDGFEDRFAGRSYRAFCTEVQPGYEIEVTLKVRQWGGRDVIALRPGGDAGSPSALMWVSEEQFLDLRENLTIDLRGLVKTAIEEVTQLTCDTTPRQTCALVYQGGKLAVRLLVSEGGLTGRPGNWESTYWEIYPHWLGGQTQFALSFDMPITAIKRWPADGDKPSGGFTSLDFDEGFETFRAAVMSRVADALDAEYDGAW